MDENRSLGDVNNTEKDITAVKEDSNNKPQETQNVSSQASQQPTVDTNQKQEPKKVEVQSTPKTAIKKKRRFHLYHIKNAVKKAHPLNIKAKLEHYKFEYSRILHLARKPTKQEFKELSIMVIIGTFIIGAIGFIIQMIIQFI
ncbi:MAG: protein translocase SEC61 complex, gamma subunit [Candidatus Parvarchaeum acidophilus ARMAN-5]|jgi:protein transport protein SEC61 subunit gamma-like protein|uniref:Protein translocase SEC61 complex, gamma subunit n=1 Tax=Candidatus Parvarchaeum acidophilus ARMAN-5 TaxID=662762 RepID=D6GVG9_PARA5|nr:MAG: protein translocase SEC61 complex, gamma subunit [Candidatus Parvarchaeum acidophilus ARMAN-5]